MAYLDLKAPEELAALMLAECQTWRGIVTYPTYAWSELATVLDAGTIEEGDAADRIATGALAEQWDDPEFIERPRVAVRQLEDDGWSRDSTSTFSSLLRLEVLIEVPVPSDLVSSPADALLDLRRKGAGLLIDFLGLARQSGRLDVESLNATPAGLADMKAYAGQDLFGVIGWSLGCRGVV